MKNHNDHRCNWQIIGEDETGAIVKCADPECKEMAYLEPEDLVKFKALQKEGLKGYEIKLSEKVES